MGILEDALVRKLLTTTPQHKRDIIEEKIRTLLGARPMMTVTGLPSRRGPADGGIDGIVDVLCLVDDQWTRAYAVLNIKVRDSAFSREQLGGFLLDMDRERIKIGLIITAIGLSPDANSEIARKNSEGKVVLHHIFLANLISGQVTIDNLRFSNLEIASTVNKNLRAMLENN